MRSLKVTSTLVFLLVFCVPLRAGDPPWETARPRPHGIDAATLDDARDALAARSTKNFLVVRDGKIVYEWYASDAGPDRRHYTASLAKALVGGMSLLLALDDGRLLPDDPAWKYIPAWRDDSLRSQITIRHLATHSSGIEDAEQDDIPHMELPGWKGVFWRKDPDPFRPAIHDAPVLFPPGTDYAYSNPGMAALAYAVTASLRGEPQESIRELLAARVMRPIGAADEEWSLGYGQTYEVDGLPLNANWGGGSYTARATARVGQLLLQRGNWAGRQLIDPGWVDRVTSYAGTPIPDRPPGNPQPGSGLAWYSNFDRVWPNVPPDAFAGAGAGQQVMLVVPSLGLVVVRNGGVMDDETGFWGGIEEYVFNPVMKAIEGYTPGQPLTEKGPYPRSPVIRSLRFADDDTVVRRAAGSDNWPLTWADDDNLYTAYGDGWGFEPQTEKKLSLGLVKILGTPADFQGINIRSDSGEQIGQGAEGKKASGMLFVDRRLYMWVRNAANSQLAYSDDHGRTWTWSDWRFTTSFGAPAFLNFGKAYQGARDNFVYVYSHDSDSAYEPADRMVLARVPKDRILDRAAYEFFVRFNAGEPEWSTDINRRGPVFTHAGNCYRSSVTYNAALDRYLWVQPLPGEAERFFGGLGIYDAPDPWGPWTTAYFTRYFDIGPGESAHLPSKWMSADGESMYMVSSSDDFFTLRRIDIVRHTPEQTAAVSPPYPPSPSIAEVEFDLDSHQQFGEGSDQWPMTWAAGGHLLAAWGDGWGWNGGGDKKSIGITRITGGPDTLSGDDLWGDGPGSGFGKPEALIAIGDTVHMFWTSGDSISDTDNTRYAVSHDGGASWDLGAQKFFPYVPDGFRVRSIVQFGPGYDRAMDDYVYLYFAFNRASELYLGRVAKDRIRNPNAYEWFTGRSGDSATWSADFAQKRPAFIDPNGYLWHVGVSHLPALDRFLLAKPHYYPSDDRDSPLADRNGLAGLGIFDAPAPWGPWTTLYYADNFIDDRVKFNYVTPAKFYDPATGAFWLAFSGWPEYDNVNFVRGRLQKR